MLIDDGSDVAEEEHAGAEGDITEALKELADVLSRSDDNCQYFAAVRGYTAAMMYMTDSYVEENTKMLYQAAGTQSRNGNEVKVMWPKSMIDKLVSLATSHESSGLVKLRTLEVGRQ
eukprot:scaffold2809_cov373-Prasinococcus_capsulatus_cf.AAC.3